MRVDRSMPTQKDIEFSELRLLLFVLGKFTR